MRLPELKSLAKDRRLRNYYRMRKAELVALLQNNGRAPAPPPPPQRCEAYVTLKFDNGRCRIHSAKRGEARVSEGDKEIVTNERYFVMPWKMVNVDGKKVSLKEAVDEIFSNRDELTNSMYVTLKLYDKGSCKIHRVCSQLGDLKLEEVRIAVDKVKCPRKLDISVFHQLTGRLPHEDLNGDDDERLLYHFYDIFYNESIKLFHKMIRCRTNLLYHSLNKTGKSPNADSFHFMKEPAHQRTEEEIKFVFDSLGWNYSPLCGAKGPPIPAPALASKVSLSPSTRNL